MTIYKTRKLLRFNSFNSKEQRITFGTVNYLGVSKSSGNGTVIPYNKL